MKLPPCFIRIGITRPLKVLMVLAWIKFSLLLAWGVGLDLYDPFAAGNPALPVPAAILASGGQTPAYAADVPPLDQADAQSPTYSERWERLSRKQQEIDRREQEIRQHEQELDAKLARLENLEARLKKMLDEADVLKDEKLKHLVDVYTNMKAKEAAQVLETLDQNIAVKILAGMRGRTAGSILSFVEPKKAARLSEALTQLQMPFEH